jgi:hypothetical protein
MKSAAWHGAAKEKLRGVMVAALRGAIFREATTVFFSPIRRIKHNAALR